MKLVFDKHNFKMNAPLNVKRAIPQEHLDVLDGLEVDYQANKWGIIPFYKVPSDEETDYYLTPVPEEWCRRESQLKLFH